MSNRLIDERIVETRRKVAARGFYLFLWGLMIILLYRQFYLGQEFSDYGDVFILWLGGCLYVTFGGTLSGLNVFGGGKFNMIVVPLVISCTTVGVGIYKGSVQTLPEGIIGFLTSLAGVALMYYLILLLYKRWEKNNIGQ